MAPKKETTALEISLEASDSDAYNEEADEDFNLTAVTEEDASSSSADEDAADAPALVKKASKRKAPATEDLDSGDEETIKERKRVKWRKHAAEQQANEGEYSGGEGGVIKTRAQRQAEKVQKKAHRRTDGKGVTVDVEALWADLSAKLVGRPPTPVPNAIAADDAEDHENAPAHNEENGEEYITIKRTYQFAGETTVEEKRVHKNSAEGKHYLASNPEPATAEDEAVDPDKPVLHRPLKRPSMFEPNPTGAVRGLAPERQRLRAPSRADVLLRETRLEEERTKKAQRMTTVQKSAMDWAGFVDKEGIQEELDEYGRSKASFVGQASFLGNVEAKRMAAGREARMKG